MNKKTVEETKCVTPEFRVSFPHVFNAHTGFEGQEAKFSLVMLFDKKTDLSDIKRAAMSAATSKWGSDQKKWPKGLRLPFRDGDEKSDLEGYDGKIFITASSKQRPGLVDQSLAPITEADDSFYAGCYARAEINAFTYDKAGNKGVSFGLQNIQKLRDGDRFSGRRRAEDVFQATSEEDQEARNDDDEDNSLSAMGL